MSRRITFWSRRHPDADLAPLVPPLEDGVVVGFSGEDLLGLQRGAGGHWRQVALSSTDWLAESETITSGHPEPPTVDWEDRGPLTDGGQRVTGDLRDLALDPTGTRLAFTRPKGGEREYVAGPLDGTAWRVLSPGVRPIPNPAWLAGVPLAEGSPHTLVRADTGEVIASAPAGISELSLSQWVLDKR